MTDLVVLVPLFLLAIPAAMAAHELTHFVAARMVGLKATIVVSVRRPMFVRYGDGETPPERHQELVVELAPFLAGLIGGTAWLAIAGYPEPSPISLLAVLAWIDYTLVESARDLGVLEAPDEAVEGFNREVLRMGAAFGLVVLIQITPYGSHPIVQRYLVLPLALAGVGVGLYAAVREARNEWGGLPAIRRSLRL